MKFLEMRRLEKQSLWFGQRGMNWHISVATYLKDGKTETVTFIHVFDQCNQDAATTMAIITAVMENIKKLIPAITHVYFKTDNAASYHGNLSVFVATEFNKSTTFDIRIKRWDFSDPQAGKSICDRRAAHVKSQLRYRVCSGMDILNSNDFVNAAESSDIHNTTFIDTLPLPFKTNCPSIQDVSLLHNFYFTDSGNGVRVWRQYEVGIGRYIPLDSFNMSSFKAPDLIEVRKTEIKSKPIVPPRQPRPERVYEEENTLILNDSKMIPCPDADCLRTFFTHGQMTRHVDIGNHTYPVDNFTRRERVRLTYISKVSLPNSAIPALSCQVVTQQVSQLKKGFALKERKSTKKFNEKQKGYLIEKYMIGEATGRKFKAAEVAELMKEDGRFSLEEFLSEDQIKGFFSRYTSKQRVQDPGTNETERTNIKAIAKKTK